MARQNALKSFSKIFQSPGVHEWIDARIGHYQNKLDVPGPMNKDAIAVCAKVDDVNTNT